MSTPANKSSTETFFNVNELWNKIYVQGTTVPADTTSGYEKGCLFVDMDVATGTSGLYQNKGTNTSCAFELVPVASTGSVTTLTASSTITGAAGIVSTGSTQGIGYATGAGGTVTQITNRSTWVTLNKITGYIQTDTTSLAAGAAATFTVTNSTVAIGDVVCVAIRSGVTTVQTLVRVSAVAAGSFNITVENNHASTAETGAILINFAVIKAVSA